MKSLSSFLTLISIFFTCFQSAVLADQEANKNLMDLVNNRKLKSAWEFQSDINALKEKNTFTKHDIDTALTALNSKTNGVRDISKVPEGTFFKKYWKNSDRAIGKAEYAKSILSLAPQDYKMSDSVAKSLLKRNNIGHNTKLVAEAAGIGALGAVAGTLLAGPVGGAVIGVPLGAATALDNREKWVGKKDRNLVKALIEQHGGKLPAKKETFYQKMKSSFSKRVAPRRSK